MQILWKALDLLNKSAPMDLQQASQTRLVQLKTGLKRLFDEKILSKEHVQKVLEYTKRTIFGHL